MNPFKLPKPTKIFPREIGNCAAYYYLTDISDKALLREYRKRTTKEQRKAIKDKEYWDIPSWNDFAHIWLSHLLRDVMTIEELSSMTEIVLEEGFVKLSELEWDSGVKAE